MELVSYLFLSPSLSLFSFLLLPLLLSRLRSGLNFGFFFGGVGVFPFLFSLFRRLRRSTPLRSRREKEGKAKETAPPPFSFFSLLLLSFPLSFPSLPGRSDAGEGRKEGRTGPF